MVTSLHAKAESARERNVALSVPMQMRRIQFLRRHEYSGCVNRRRALIIGATALLLAGCRFFGDREPEIAIQADFGTKIVYGTDQSLNVTLLEGDCARRGGQFSTCGSPCAPDAAACIEVCAFTCTLGEPVSAPPVGNELIRVDSPRPNDIIDSPLTVEGEARGTWYFEATFPVELRDDAGKILVQTYATAQGEWMTENFVPFSTEVTFDPGSAKGGTLILHKDNPSGLPENNASVEISVRFTHDEDD